MRIRLTFLVLLGVLLTLAPGCGTIADIGRLFRSNKGIDTTGATPPSDFKFTIRTRDISNPPVDYEYQFLRSGKATHDVTVRSPKRRQDAGEFEISEDQIMAIWRILHDVQFEKLDPVYPAAGDGPDRTQGVQTYYAFGDGQESRVESRFQSVAALEKIRTVVLGVVPKDIQDALGGKKGGMAKEYIADTTTRVFHVPDCTKLKDVPAQQRQAFASPWDALNFGNQPCPDCRPMPSSTTNK